MTDNVVSLAAVRAAKEPDLTPDPEFISDDGRGHTIYLFACVYEYRGDPWALDLWAYNQADAKRRVEAICQGLNMMGQMMHTYDAGDPPYDAGDPPT
jgi:hypothetical protein